jgi:dipeptidyl aminopeptidase/acylaminoacyl peptidase
MPSPTAPSRSWLSARWPEVEPQVKRRLYLAVPLIAFALSICGVTKAMGAPSMRDVLTATYRVRELKAVELSPAGRAVAWEEDFHDPVRLLESPVYSSVYIRGVGGTAPAERVTAGARDGYYDGYYKEENPVWSPDGRRIAFLSDARSKGQLQLFIADAGGENVREVTRFTGDVQRLTWAPNGNALAVLYIAAAHRLAGALAPGARDVGVIGSTVDEQRLATVDPAGGAVRFVTPANVYVYEYGWSPDGREIAATYAKGNGDNNWWIARLARIDVASGAMHDLLAPAYQLDDPQWSPDGSRIAVIGGIMSDFGPTGGDVYLVDARSGESRDVTDGAQVSVESIRWNDASSLNLVAHVSGAMRLMRLDVAGGTAALTSLTDREESLWSWSSAVGGSIVALVRATFSDPPEVWAGRVASLRRISSSNAGATRLYGKAVSLQWQSDGLTVQGWLIYPLNFNPAARYPMVTIIHGGPSSETVPSFGSRNLSGLASQGYFVFMPNPRGSYGRGEAFTRANIKDFGYGDWRDDLAGVDTALKAAPIDPNRLGLMGWSYGGYMGMWAETQTARFKAIVAGAGIVNWQSYYGQNKIDQWMVPYFGASVYQDPAVYARSSPITFITQSKTPVLILQGERDEEVPAPQAFEFWHAMVTLGVPTKLIVYADEGHGPRKIVNQIDILSQTLAWFDRFLGV